MKAVKGSQDKPQRRIIIENEHLIALFDLLAAGISLEKDMVPIPIEFSEEDVVEVSLLIEEICDTIIQRVSINPILTLVKDLKTQELSVKEQVVFDAINRYINENSDDVRGLVVSALHVTLKDAVKEIVDELVRSAELFNMKQVVIKTRKHALVIC